MFEPLSIRRNPADEKFRVDGDTIELTESVDSGPVRPFDYPPDLESTIVWRDGRISFATDVASRLSHGKPTTHAADFVDGQLVASSRPLRLYSYYVDKTGVVGPEVRKRFPPMLARFRTLVEKSPEALRVMGLAEYMRLSSRSNPTFEVPRWAWWAAGGAAVAGVLLASSNAGAAPFPSIRTDVPHRDEYDTLFSTCIVNPSRVAQVDRLIERIKTNRARYEQVQSQTQVPWWFIAAVHSLEADLSFTTHLHNGDPLTARTRQVPANRPVAGNPPFTWEESALDALAYDHVSGWHDWTVGGALYELEKYNGWGYRGRGIYSPYLWSFSNHYVRGKYVRDGVWDPNAVSGQCGGGTLWRRMQDLGLIRIEQ